jgi:hypothetical protein
MTIPDLQAVGQPGTFRLELPVAQAQCRLLSKKARAIANGQDVLFHGARYRERILASGFLKFSDPGPDYVAFTRSAEVAAYWATCVPREDDEGAGAILVFDRPSLKTRCKARVRRRRSRRDLLGVRVGITSSRAKEFSRACAARSSKLRAFCRPAMAVQREFPLVLLIALYRFRP